MRKQHLRRRCRHNVRRQRIVTAVMKAHYLPLIINDIFRKSPLLP